MSFENLDCFLSGMHPMRFQKPSGKKKNKKKRAASEGDSVSTGQEPSAPTTAELTRLHAALESEQRNRTRLENRLEDLEARLQQVLATTDGAAAEAAREELALHDLRAQLQFELEIQEQQEVLETWMLEATLRADDKARAIQRPARPVQQPIPQPLYHEPPVSVAPAALPPDDRLREANLAMEAAEARAAHNASQVRKLTEELAAARADQMRTSARLKELSARLDMTETTIDAPANRYLDLPAAPDVEAPWEVDDELVAETSAFESPGNVQPETPIDEVPVEEETNDASADEIPAGDPTEKFEAPALTFDAPIEQTESADLAAELLAWGAGDSDSESVNEVEEEDPFDAIAEVANNRAADDTESTDLADALVAWGAGENDAEPLSAPEEPVETAPLTSPSENDFTEDPPQTDVSAEKTGDDIFDTLADALTNWGQGDTQPAPDTKEITPEPSASELDLSASPDHETIDGQDVPDFEEETSDATIDAVGNDDIPSLELPDVPPFAPEDIPDTEDFEAESPHDASFAKTPVTGIDSQDHVPEVREEDQIDTEVETETDALVAPEDADALVLEAESDPEETPSPEQTEPLPSVESVQQTETTTPDIAPEASAAEVAPEPEETPTPEQTESVQQTETILDDDLPKFDDEIDTIDAPEIHPDDVISDSQESSFDEAADQNSAWDTPAPEPDSSLLDRMVGRSGGSRNHVSASDSASEEVAADAVFKQGRPAEEAEFAVAHTDFTPDAEVRAEPSAQREDIASNLRGWSGMAPRARDENRPQRKTRTRPPETPPSESSPMNPPTRSRRAPARPEGKQAMMNALMRFMGTDKDDNR